MASRGKKKTTMAKLTRESRLRERRLDKQARKDARKYAAANPTDPADDELTDGELGDGELSEGGEGGEGGEEFADVSSSATTAEPRSAEV